MLKVNELVELAKEVEVADPIDWSNLNIQEDDAYKLIALSMLEKFPEPWDSFTTTTMLAVITKLVVENFVLNLKLADQG